MSSQSQVILESTEPEILCNHRIPTRAGMEEQEAFSIPFTCPRMGSHQNCDFPHDA